MPNDLQTKVPVVVIGGGPAGSTAAALIAEQGYGVQLFEREKFPRYHIGESLIPETFWVLQRLGVLDKMRNSPFVKKYSVQFVGSSGKLSEPFYFTEHKPHESSQTWQVVRSEFDEMLLNHARERGARVFEGARVLEVLFENARAVGVRVRLENGEERVVRSQVVVDAGGQSSMIMSRLGLREWDPELKKAALWTYWEGAYRDTGCDEGATIVLQLDNREGWFWYIPLHNNVISVGVVASFEYLFKNRGGNDFSGGDSAHAKAHEGTDRAGNINFAAVDEREGSLFEKIYFEEVDRCPVVKERIQNARRAGPFRAAKEYSYRSRKAAGDGWVLAGDALGFLDPLYSSGVLLALKSGQLAADAICEGLAKDDTSAAQLGQWETAYFEGMERMRRLVVEYYNGFSFGRFVAQYPHYKGHLTDLLIGDLWRDEVAEVFEPMDKWRSQGS